MITSYILKVNSEQEQNNIQQSVIYLVYSILEKKQHFPIYGQMLISFKGLLK